MAGRATLVRAVLTSLPAYHMQTMLLPKGLLKEINRLSCNFLWGDEEDSKKLHLIAWDQVTKGRKDGGLGIKNLRRQNEAFILKLCWKLLTDKNSLWVKTLRAKYRCDQLGKLEVGKQRNSSHTWRGICEMWPQFIQGIRKKIGNGRSTSFWFDNWADMLCPLIELIPGMEATIDYNERVMNYVNLNGKWNHEKLQQSLPTSILERILCSYPPSTHTEMDSIWKSLWRWKVPEKIKAFMWIAAHDRVHTAELRKSWGISDEATCPFGCPDEETMMHMIRDCKNARYRWQSVVTPEMWNTFNSLQGKDWIKWNLRYEAGRHQFKKIHWGTLFGYMCWDIWVDRCKRVFNDNSSSSPTNGFDSFYRASWDNDLVEHCRFYSEPPKKAMSSHMAPEGFIKLEVDGSVSPEGKSGCGGVIREEDGRWLEGFNCKLTAVPPVIAELIGTINGLQLCWNRGFRKVFVQTDCIEAINLITRGCDIIHPYRDVVQDARSLVHMDWKVIISHCHREEIPTADYLAKLSLSQDRSFCLFGTSPIMEREISVV